MQILLRPVPRSIVQKFILAFGIVVVALAMSSVALAADGVPVPGFTGQLVEMLSGALLQVIGLGVAALTAAATHFIVSRTGFLKAQDIMRLVETFAMQVVTEVFQTMVEQIKKASADGRLTGPEGRHILSTALAKLKERLGGNVLKYLSKKLGGDAQADAMLTGALEKAIGDRKLMASVQLENKEMLLP